MQPSTRFNALNGFIFGSQSRAEEDEYLKASNSTLFLNSDSKDVAMDLVVSDLSEVLALSYCQNEKIMSTRGALPGYAQFTLSKAEHIDELFTKLRTGMKLFFINHIEHSHSRLRITLDLFNRLLHKAAIFPAVKDSILRMGSRDGELEIAPPCARSQVNFEQINSCVLACGAELVYGFRFIERNGRKTDRSEGKPWSLRQFFAYNMTHYITKDSRWVFFSLPEAIRKQLNDYLAHSSQEIVQHPFDIHVLLASAAIRMWRPYFVYLTDEVESHRRRVAGTDVSNKDAVQKACTDMMNELKVVESDILDAFLAVRATKDTLIKIRSLFKSLSPQEGLNSEDEDCHNLIAQVLSDQLREVDMLMEQATSLQQKTTRLLATVADFLSLANAYWQEGNAEAVKGLTIIATIFLPVTVVFGFFSTSFIDRSNYSGQPMGRWWLLLACGLPLSFATMLGWYLWIHRGRVKQRFSRSGQADSENTVQVSSTTGKTDPQLKDTATGSNVESHEAGQSATDAADVTSKAGCTTTDLTQPTSTIERFEKGEVDSDDG